MEQWDGVASEVENRREYETAVEHASVTRGEKKKGSDVFKVESPSCRITLCGLYTFTVYAMSPVPMSPSLLPCGKKSVISHPVRGRRGVSTHYVFSFDTMEAPLNTPCSSARVQ